MADDYQECARGSRCHDAARTDSGELVGTRTPRAFCDPCTDIIASTVGELPGLYRELGVLLGEKPRSSFEPVTTTRKALLPIREDVEAAMVHMVEALTSWEARVRRIAGLPEAPTMVGWGRHPSLVERACTLLSTHITVLLALTPAGMWRTVSLEDAAALPAGTAGEVYPSAGYARVRLHLDGRTAGLELLELHRRATGTCGHTRPVEAIVGVDCPHCGMMALTRRPGDDGVLCHACRARIPDEEYREWTRERAEQEKRSA